MLSMSRVTSVVGLAALIGGPLSMAPVFAQSIPVAQTAPVAASVVSGLVTDPASNPIGGATITLTGAHTYTATSDAQGRYTISGVAPGIYTASVTRAGFLNGSEQDVAVTAGTPMTLNVQLAAPTLSTLRTIGSTRTTFSRTQFNTSPASVNVVSTQAFIDQGQPQVTHLLNQIPGIIISLPATSGNGAAPGAITFPNIRGGLSFETASLIDGHPVSVGAFGDYVTTFLPSYMLGSVEVVKGPGATAPSVNYAIGGTVNFRTLDPTRKPTGFNTIGIDSFGGSVLNLGYSNTVWGGKLGFVVDYFVNGTQGPLNNFQVPMRVGATWLVNGAAITGGTGSNVAIPGTSQTYFNKNTNLLFAGLPVSSTYNNRAELAKIKYNFSDATSLTASFLGSQTWTEQNGNHFYNELTNFNPGAAYNSITGPQPGSLYIEDNVFPPQHEYEINNEPIFQAEVRSSFQNNNILLRGYSASISRLQYNGLNSPAQPALIPTQLYGTATVGGVAKAYNGQNVVLTVPSAYFNDSEEDRLHGYSLEVDHPFGGSGNFLSIADDYSHSVTGKYNIGTFIPGPTGSTAGVPPSSSVAYNTVLVRYTGSVGPRTQLTLSNFFNTYLTHYSTNNGLTFIDQHTSHSDPRIALTYRATPNTSLRAAAGSAIAPPYIGLYSRVTSLPLIDRSNNFATNTEANPNLVPETSFGINLGADLRVGGDRQTNVSLDYYRTNLFNQLIGTSQYAHGSVTVKSYQAGDATGTPTGPLVTVPLTSTGSTNLASARYQGVELSVRRDPAVGFGYTANLALQQAQPVNVPLSFYTNPGSTLPVRNLGVIPNQNFYGGSQGVSNQSVPYSQGYGELRYRFPRGGLLAFGETYYGPNNSLFVPAFFIANANASIPLSHGLSFNVNVDNAFNALNRPFIYEYQGQFQPYINGASTTGGAPLSGAQLNANTYGPRNVRLSLSYRVGQK